MKYILLLIFSLLQIASLLAQEKYWAFFEEQTDESRICENYITELETNGFEIQTKSQWLNAVSLWLEPEEIIQLEAFSFIKNIRKVARLKTETHNSPATSLTNGTNYLTQLDMIGLDVLHANGFTGKGVKIAVFDNGFSHIDSLAGFKHLREEGRIIGSKDFIDPNEDPLRPCSKCRHGTEVLSVLAAKIPGRLMGAASDAEYILLRTENSYSETHLEEDIFVEAVEYADSLGAKIFNLSYGFRDFDLGEGDYDKSDMDGNTAIITKIADMAAQKGILVIASAGNLERKGITAPSDGDSVLAVGGVDENRDYYFESSQGPSADGRVKPDLTAMGEGICLLHYSGEIRQANGTSFAAPLITGLAACLWQAVPEATNMEIYQALIQSANQYDSPDIYLGYGIPDGLKALSNLNTGVFFDPNLTYHNIFEKDEFAIFPNPSTGNFYLSASPSLVEFQGKLTVLDQLGRILHIEEVFMSRNDSQKFIQLPQLKTGIYNIRFTDHENSGRYYVRKILVLDN